MECKEIDVDLERACGHALTALTALTALDGFKDAYDVLARIHIPVIAPAEAARLNLNSSRLLLMRDDDGGPCLGNITCSPTEPWSRELSEGTLLLPLLLGGAPGCCLHRIIHGAFVAGTLRWLPPSSSNNSNETHVLRPCAGGLDCYSSLGGCLPPPFLQRVVFMWVALLRASKEAGTPPGKYMESLTKEMEETSKGPGVCMNQVGRIFQDLEREGATTCLRVSLLDLCQLSSPAPEGPQCLELRSFQAEHYRLGVWRSFDLRLSVWGAPEVIWEQASHTHMRMNE